MQASFYELKLAFSPIPPRIVWQEVLDTDIRVVKRLSGHSSKPAQEDDLYLYLLHLRFSGEIQGDLFQFLFPACMDKWHRELMAKSGSTGFTEQFHATLFRCEALEKLLTARQQEATLTFMRDALLDRLGLENELAFYGRSGSQSAYGWLGFFNVYGAVATDMERLWKQWWSMETPGHAVAALQYASCLMYPEAENPVYSAWTPNEGGGPPLLWGYESADYDCHWRSKNIEFLMRNLTVEYLGEKIDLAVERLRGESGYSEAYLQAERIHRDFSTWSWVVESRVTELSEKLAISDEMTSLDWSL